MIKNNETKNNELKKNNFKTRDTPFFTFDLNNKNIDDIEKEFPEINKYKLDNQKNIKNANLLEIDNQIYNNFIKELGSLYKTNIWLVKKLSEKLEIIDELQEKYDTIKLSKIKKNNEIRDCDDNNLLKKRIRKKKSEVERFFHCKFENCKKSYGTENSLNQHIKLKHLNEN